MTGSVPAKLWGCFGSSALVYGAILLLAPTYALSVPVGERPILGVLGLYSIAFVVYLFALRWAIRAESSQRLVAWLIGTSIVFRVVLLPTPPFQEIDIYRYLWDGAVVASGHDPYEHPPRQIVDGLDGVTTNDQELNRLVNLAKADPTLGEIVREIHYAELPSPYPPVSQAVFAAADATTPGPLSAFGRLVWLKGWLTLFDVATLLVVVWLLRVSELPAGGALAYGWCPLVLKEIAGSGHLDAIATFLAIAALALGVFAFRGSGKAVKAGVAAVVLGLAVGAKLYPVVLAPLLAATFLRRLGWKVTLAATVVFVITTAVTLWPMLGPSGREPIAQAAAVSTGGVESLPPPPGYTPAEMAKTSGLAAFLNQWEMNDLLFMVVYENLRTQNEIPPERLPWFDVTPEAWSGLFAGQDDLAFRVTRLATLLVFAVIAVWLAWDASNRFDQTPEGLRAWLSAAFLTLAWFWLLAPTQNPWYWCWAVPLLPWAGSRAWIAVAGVVMAYYLRFWLESAFPSPGVLGTRYDGEFFFYFVVAWLEFLPLFIWLLVSKITKHVRQGSLASDAT